MTFLDWWVPPTPLDAGETERFTILANRSSANATAGGTLVATDRRLMFRPSRIDRAFGGKVWSVPFARITEYGKRARTWHPFNGGLRTRLRVVTDDQAEHLFVVNGLDDVIAKLQALR